MSRNLRVNSVLVNSVRFGTVSPSRRWLLLALVALVGASACGGDNRRCARPPNSWQDETVKPFERDDDTDVDTDDDDDETGGETGGETGAATEQPATEFFYLSDEASDDEACDE